MAPEISLLCRICLRNTSNIAAENIYDLSSSSKLSLFKMLSLICSEVFSDPMEPFSFPRSVCITCRKKVVSAYELYEKCVESDRKLRELCIVKLENTDVNFVEIPESSDSMDTPLSRYFKTEHDQIEAEAVAEDSNDITVMHPCVVKLQYDQSNESFISAKSGERHLMTNLNNESKKSNGDLSISEQNSQFADSGKHCFLCLEMFLNDASLKEHLRKIHPESHISMSDPLNECDEIKANENMLMSEENSQNQINEKQAGLCLQNFCNDTSPKRQEKKIHPDSREDYPLVHSNPLSDSQNESEGAATIENISNLEQNTQIPDTGEHCVICSKNFSSKSSLKRHLRKIHPGDRNPSNKCDEEKTDLDPAFACQLCDKKFHTAGRLREHTRRHSSRQPFLCTICGKGFNDNSNLRQHLMRHSGRKTFSCDQCPSKFYTKAEKATHMVTHTKEKRWACETCGTRFTMKNSLVKHERIHSGDRPFPCDVCDLRFAASDHLKRHKRIHTGERPYKCHFCERSYSQINDLVKHSRTHLGSDNLYQCDRCTSSFRLLTDLRDHYKVHFQSGNATKQGDSYSSEVHPKADEVRFTSLDMLKRIYEREQQRVNISEQHQRRETVTSIPVDISEIPTAEWCPQ
ncbi:zinc finger protein 260-like [Topomyia yanbarensis]|uniref:zinc finger protein 260-like n=1 Tax=Topomyia yanbarensis TaxID=2498891 RepID=UPI00273AC57F|nr:zinc finger protein 260-like [Topomyia yanbarensis]